MVLQLLKLIRVKNLAIIALSQFMLWYLVLGTILGYRGFSLQLGTFQFAVLVLSTCMAAAAGYIINDYYDIEIDLLNKPSEVVIGRTVSKTTAMNLYWIFTVCSIVLGFYLGYYVGVLQLGLINVFRAGILWYYSTEYKRQFLIGNIVVALMIAVVPLELVVYEVPLLIKEYRNILILTSTNLNVLFYFLAGFAAFAFLLNLIREIIKDLQDALGDSAFGCTTMAIVWGTAKTKNLLYLLVTLCSVGLWYFQYVQFLKDDWISAVYFLVSVQLPLAYLVLLINRAQKAVDYSKASMVCKIIMLAGLCYSLVFYWF